MIAALACFVSMVVVLLVAIDLAELLDRTERKLRAERLYRDVMLAPPPWVNNPPRVRHE
jgi:hypothetical protein